VTDLVRRCPRLDPHWLSVWLLFQPLSIVRVFGTNCGLNEETVWLIWLASLRGALSVMQAWRFERLSFDPFPLLQDGFIAPEVDVRLRDVVRALVVALMIVMIDKGSEIFRQTALRAQAHANDTQRRAQARVLESQKIIKACGGECGGEKNQNLLNHCYEAIF
jgi:hypothetical protein